MIAKEKVEERRKICRSNECKIYLKEYDRCGGCGCKVEAKTKQFNNPCPKKLWF